MKKKHVQQSADHARSNCLNMADSFREKAAAARRRGQLKEAQRYLEEADRWKKRAESWDHPDQKPAEKHREKMAAFFAAIAETIEE